MSNKFINLETVKCKDLRLPISSFFEYERTDLHPEIVKTKEGKTIIDFGEEEIVGVEKNGYLLVDKIFFIDDFSEIYYKHFLLPALLKSTGTLVIVVVQEDGSISITESVDGAVKKIDIDYARLYELYKE